MNDTNKFWCSDPWYLKLEAKYGVDFCVDAGWFEEDRPWMYPYSDVTVLPENNTVIQFSGAFYPFHDGHLEIIKGAIDLIYARARHNVNGGVVIIHVDHHRYRSSKGKFDETSFKEMLSNLPDYKNFKFQVVFEDDMFLSCSRNFTRLYQELLDKGNHTYFLCGGDRANFAQTFIDSGRCIVIGRSTSKIFEKYENLKSDRLWFMEGNNPMSSSQIRNNTIAS